RPPHLRARRGGGPRRPARALATHAGETRRGRSRRCTAPRLVSCRGRTGMGGRGTGRHPVRLPRPTPRADPPPARAVARGGPLLGDAAHRGHRGDGAAVRTGGAPRDGGEPALPARSATTNRSEEHT